MLGQRTLDLPIDSEPELSSRNSIDSNISAIKPTISGNTFTYRFKYVHIQIHKSSCSDPPPPIDSRQEITWSTHHQWRSQPSRETVCPARWQQLPTFFTATESFSHTGEFYDIPDMTFTTKPVQDPLSMWWGGMGPRNPQRGAERGMNIIAPFNAGYDAPLTAAGRNPADRQISVMIPVCVADTTEKAWEIAGPGIEYFVNFYQLRKDLTGIPAPEEARVTTEMLRTGNAGFWFAAGGTPQEVASQVAGNRKWTCNGTGNPTGTSSSPARYEQCRHSPLNAAVFR
jgi:hypothetical protein